MLRARSPNVSDTIGFASIATKRARTIGKSSGAANPASFIERSSVSRTASR